MGTKKLINVKDSQKDKLVELQKSIEFTLKNLTKSFPSVYLDFSTL